VVMIGRRSILKGTLPLVAARKGHKPMPWQNSVYSLLIVTSTGGFAGLFTYSPAPGPGNLIASEAGHDGVDPFGNHYFEGKGTYDNASGLAMQLDGGVQNFFTGSDTGGWTQVSEIAWSSTFNALTFAVGNVLVDNQLLVNPGHSAYTSAVLEVVGGAAIDLATALNGTALEVANSLGSLGASGINIAEATYYLLPIGVGGKNMGFISIKGATTGSGPTAGSTTFPNTMSIGYRPTSATALPCGSSNIGDVFMVSVGTGGGVTLRYPTVGSGITFSCQCPYDLQ
jgi:hypothetical protein